MPASVVERRGPGGDHRPERAKAARSPWVRVTARAGLVARGVLYLVVAALSLQVAGGDGHERADKEGAFETIARQPFGRLLLVVLAAGFAAYAVWRFVQAVVGAGMEGARTPGWAKRLVYVGRGLVYAGLFVPTLHFLCGSEQEAASGREVDVTARVMKLPLGRWAVGAVGVGVVVGGLYVGYRGLGRKYRERLETGRMSARTERIVTGVATVGMVSRMVVFALVGTFLVRAAVRFDPREAVGVDGALRRLAGQPHGPWLLVLVAVGLLAFGVFSLVEARYRQVVEPSTG